jgi:hypothetical protein
MLETPVGTVHREQPLCVKEAVSAAAGAAATRAAISAAVTALA